MKSPRRAGLLLLLLLTSFAALESTAAKSTQIRYQITDLGTLGGARTFPEDLNDRGQVVGYSETTPGVFRFHAFLWERGEMRDLGTLGGDSSSAWAINRHGHVVGEALTETGATHAVLWKNRIIRDLGTLPGGATSQGRDINDRGEIVGFGDTFIANRFGVFDVSRGFIWKNGRMRSLDDLDPRPGPEEGSSFAIAINNRGITVGEAERIRGGPAWPVLWQAGSTHRIRPLAQIEGFAASINDVGQVVGRVGTFPAVEAFEWKNARLRQLPGLSEAPGSGADAINRRGQIVGSAGSRAVLWSGETVTDLNDLIPEDLGWSLRSATAINRSGQIVGVGVHDGTDRAFLLTPE